MTAYGYARASADGQTLDAQLEALKAAGCERVFRETASGAPAERRRLGRLLAAVGEGDVLIVTRLDRLARSTRDLLDIIGTLAERGTAFRSLDDPWADTTTPHGGLTPTVLGGLAAFERELIRARTGEGRARARARGQRMGRPPALTPHQRREAVEALAAGTATQAELARRFDVSQATISRLTHERAAMLPPAARPSMDAETERAARTFLRHIAGRYPVQEALLFGSRARGTHRADSDADLALVIEDGGGDLSRIGHDLAGIAVDVLTETGVLVQALPLYADTMRRPERFSNPSLIANIKRQGLRL